MEYLIFNSKYYKPETAIVTASSRGLRFGDGLFETIKSINGQLQFVDEHLARLWKGLQLLQFNIPKHFTPDSLEEEIQALLQKNKHLKMARIRLTVFRGDGGLYDEEPQAQHVNRTSWPFLANINELGLLTWMSQDAMSMLSSRAMMNERAYVCGKMQVANGKKFVNNFNLRHDDKFATLSVYIDLRTVIAQGRYLGITNRELDEETGEWRIRGLMPSVDDSRIHTGDDTIGVHVIDLKWGRKATSASGLWKAIIAALVDCS